MEQREHSFEPADHELLANLANRMRLFAMLLIGSLILSTLVGAYQMIGLGMSFGTLGIASISMLVSAAISLAIAFLTLSASGALSAAARSSGKDVTPLMAALQSLTKLFGFQYWIIVAFIVLFLLFIFGMVVMMFSFR